MGLRLKLSRTGPFPSWLQNWEASWGSQTTNDASLRVMLKLLTPLYDQISGNSAAYKKREIQWMNECQEAFDTLKVLWTSAPILAFADFTKPFKLHINASTIKLHAVLYQEQDGKDRVIEYASRALSKSKSHYPVHKLEFLALKWAVTESFQEYLFGNTFVTYSGNNPLTYVLTTDKLDATGHRWIAKLAKFNFNSLLPFVKIQCRGGCIV